MNSKHGFGRKAVVKRDANVTEQVCVSVDKTPHLYKKTLSRAQYVTSKPVSNDEKS